MMTVEGGADARRARVKSGEITPVSFGQEDLWFEVRPDPPLPPGWGLSTRSGAIRFYRPEADGGFRIRLEPDSLSELRLIRLEANPATVRLATLAAEEMRSPYRLSLPETLVAGRLTTDGDEPKPLANVEIQLVPVGDTMAQAWATTDPSGSFLLPHLRPGSYFVKLGSEVLQVLTVAEGQPLTLGEIAVRSPLSP
jgi:hypothetical protein